jgi:hypothetical protein
LLLVQIAFPVIVDVDGGTTTHVRKGIAINGDQAKLVANRLHPQDPGREPLDSFDYRDGGVSHGAKYSASVMLGKLGWKARNCVCDAWTHDEYTFDSSVVRLTIPGA